MINLSPEQKQEAFKTIEEFPDDGTDWDGVHALVMLKIIEKHQKSKLWDKAQTHCNGLGISLEQLIDGVDHLQEIISENVKLKNNIERIYNEAVKITKGKKI